MRLCCIGSQFCISAEPENFFLCSMNFLSQAGLPLIKAGIEEAWLEGRGELTDDQVCIFDIIFPFSGDWFELCVNLSVFLKKSLKFSFFYLVQLVDSTQKILTVPKTLCRWRQLWNGNWAWRQSRGDNLQNRSLCLSLSFSLGLFLSLSWRQTRGGQLAEQANIEFFFFFVFVPFFGFVFVFVFVLTPEQGGGGNYRQIWK